MHDDRNSEVEAPKELSTGMPSSKLHRRRIPQALTPPILFPPAGVKMLVSNLGPEVTDDDLQV